MDSKSQDTGIINALAVVTNNSSATTKEFDLDDRISQNPLWKCDHSYDVELDNLMQPFRLNDLKRTAVALLIPLDLLSIMDTYINGWLGTGNDVIQLLNSMSSRGCVWSTLALWIRTLIGLRKLPTSALNFDVELTQTLQGLCNHDDFMEYTCNVSLLSNQGRESTSRVFISNIGRVLIDSISRTKLVAFPNKYSSKLRRKMNGWFDIPLSFVLFRTLYFFSSLYSTVPDEYDRIFISLKDISDALIDIHNHNYVRVDVRSNTIRRINQK
jgi:hypothetical protein